MPVWCVLPACCPYLPACSALRGVVYLPGVYLPRGRLLARGRGYLPRYSTPWTEFLTHATESITLPQTSFAGGKNLKTANTHLCTFRRNETCGRVSLAFCIVMLLSKQRLREATISPYSSSCLWFEPVFTCVCVYLCLPVCVSDRCDSSFMVWGEVSTAQYHVLAARNPSSSSSRLERTKMETQSRALRHHRD